MIRTPLSLVLVLVFQSVSTAQVCGTEVVLKRLDAGTVGPELTTPDGAPVVGGPFSLRIENAFPNSSGALVYSPVEAPFFDPTYGVTFHFGAPFSTVFFGTDSEGSSPKKFVLPAVDPSLCGGFVIFQAGVFDPGAQNGVAVTNALRMRVGEVRRAPYPGARVIVNAGFSDSSRSVATGDFDGDGIPDVVSGSTAGVSVALGSSDGRFGDHQDIASGWESHSVAVAYLDGDSFLDIAATRTPSEVCVFLGNGDGTFASEVCYSAGSAPFWVSIEDLDGDTDSDMVVVNRMSDDVSILLGNGDGTFQAATSRTVGDDPHEVRIALIDGDSDLDLAVVNKGSGDVSILLGNGNGTFGPVTIVPIAGAPVSLALADFDGDTELDLAVARFNPNQVGILPGNGDGTFGAMVLYQVQKNPVTLVVHDVDGDSELDVVVGNLADATVSVLRGVGDGSFGPIDHHNVARNPRSLAFDDVDLDGDPDLLIASAATPYRGVSVWHNHGNGTFGAQGRFFAGNPTFRVKLADLDADGDEDAVVAGPSVLLGNGDGTFEAPVSIGASGSYFDIGDVDEDGILDIVSSLGPSTIVVYPGAGDGTFGSPALVVNLFYDVDELRVRRADEDSHLDIVFVTDSTISSPFFLLGNGDGTFGAPLPVGGQVFTSVEVADLDGDTIPDLTAMHHSTPENLVVFLGTGSGAFGPPVSYPTGSTNFVGPLAVGDVNDDGATDVFAGANVLLGMGDGTFDTPFVVPLVGPFGGVGAFRDVTGDGLVDLLTLEATRQSLRLHPGMGDGTFATPYVYQFGGFDFATGDLDRDGIPDLVMPDGTDEIFVFLNQIGE